MLTNTEKQILGYMVDMGSLRGQQRIDAGDDDELARGLIAGFSNQMRIFLPRQIEAMQLQKENAEIELARLQEVLNLLGA